MSDSRIVIRAPADAIFDILLDPTCYPRWVLGASQIRDVDGRWPREGAAFHHSVGVWPLRIHDTTTMARARRPTLVDLRARAWPLGEADVRIELEGRGDLTRVTMREVPVEGPGRVLGRTPLKALTTLRNRVSLGRLKRLAESRVAIPST